MTSKSMYQQTTTETPFDESTIGVPNQLCSVCGDTSTGIHFGGNSCESCKAFFRRSVQCNRYQNYKCSNEERCPVNIVTRKVCQFCRYTKCTKIGMKPKWVLSDQEREEKYGPRRKRFRESRAPDEDPDIYKFLTKEEKLLIEDIAHALYQSRATYPLQFPSHLKTYLSALASGKAPPAPPAPPPPTTTNSNEKPSNPSANFLVIPIQRFVLFARMLKDFNLFSEDDKVNLLKSSAVEIIVCSSSSLFDPQSHTFTNYISRDQRAMLDEQVIPLDPLLKRLWGEDLFNRTKNFLISMCQLHVDEVATTLLVPLLLFSPDRSNVIDLKLVKQLQTKYAQLILKYMNWRYGVTKAEEIFPKLLLQMINIRTLSSAHGEIIQKAMSTSSVNPLVQEVTVKSELFSTPISRSNRNDSMEIERNPSSVDNESQCASDDEETNRKKSRQSIDDDLGQTDFPDESNPRNIWKRNEKFDSNVQNEITNVKQVLNDHLKEKSSSSNSPNPSPLDSTTSQRRPHDHQVPNYASSPMDESMMLNNKSVRHLPPKKQSSIAHRDSYAASPLANGMNDFYQSSPAPSTPRQYPDVPSPQIKAELSALSIDGSPKPPRSQPIVTQLAAEEQQLLDAIHAHPNKRDLVLSLLRQLNESSPSSSSSPSSPMGFNMKSPQQ